MQPKRWEGGRYGYTARGLGFHVIDLADPLQYENVASLDLPLTFPWPIPPKVLHWARLIFSL